MFHKKTLKCKSLNGAVLQISVEDFYFRIKHDHKNTWKLIDEVNKNKFVKHPISINKKMLFKKEEKDNEVLVEEIELPIPTTDDLLFNIPIKSFKKP